jgi:hypothetical protein
MTRTSDEYLFILSFRGELEMFKSDDMPPMKLFFGGKEYLIGKDANLKLDSVKPAPRGDALLIGIEVTKDPVLFQKLVDAANQRSVRVQVRGQEFSTELAVQNSFQGPDFKAKIVLRQCSSMRKIPPTHK